MASNQIWCDSTEVTELIRSEQVSALSSQISKFPDVHTQVHEKMQLASKSKQENKRENGVELLKKVYKFTEMFWETKGIQTEKKYAPYPPELVIVCPILKSV